MESTQEQIEKLLRKHLAPVHLEILDESAKHRGHPGAASGGGHFQVMIVSERFEGLRTFEQHRLVNDTLAPLLKKEIHALGLKTVPASQWQG